MSYSETIDTAYRQYAKGLLAYIISFRIGRDDAMDIVQSTFIKLLDQKPGSINNLKAWLYRVARNNTLNHIARNKKTVSFDDNVKDSSGLGEGPLKKLLKDEDGAYFYKAFYLLKKEEQEMLRLRVEHELGYDEIAQIMKIRQGALRTRMSRTRKQLKENYESMREASGPSGYSQNIKNAMIGGKNAF